MKKEELHALINAEEAKELVRFVFGYSNNAQSGYTDWKLQFEAIHGKLNKQKRVHLEKLSSAYELEITAQSDLF